MFDSPTIKQCRNIYYIIPPTLYNNNYKYSQYIH